MSSELQESISNVEKTNISNNIIQNDSLANMEDLTNNQLYKFSPEKGIEGTVNEKEEDNEELRAVIDSISQGKAKMFK